MQHTGMGVVLVAALEVEVRVDAHVAGGHGNVFVVRDIDACRIVHLVIGARGDGERRYGPLAMIEHGIDVGREHTLVLVVYLYGGVGPPKEGLRHIGTVVEAAFDLEIGATGAQREARHAFLMEHLLHLAHPHRDTAVGIVLDGGVDRHIGGRTVMLRPVELDAAADPGTGQAHQGRLDDVVVVHEVAPGYLVVGHLYTAAQLGQHHHYDILVLQPNGQIVLVYLLIAHRLDDGIGIHHTTRPLIDTFLQEHRVLLGLAHLIGGNGHYFSPSFYHGLISFTKLLYC